MRDRLDVEQDRARVAVGREIVEQVAEVDVGHVAERDEMREADAARLRPVEHAVTSAPDWDTKAMLPGGGAVCAKLALSPIAGHEHADAVRAEDAQQMRARSVEHRLLHAPPVLAGLAEAGGDHDSRPGAARAQFGDEPGHVSGGVPMTARSGVFGRLATSRVAQRPSIAPRDAG